MNPLTSLARRIGNYESESSIGARLRTRRLGPLLGAIDSAFAVHGRVKVLDLGGTRSFWRIVPEEFLRSRNVSVVLANLSVPLGAKSDRVFSYVAVDACALTSMKDGEFDVVHSNSVIEHVGDWERMRRFAAEVTRVGVRYVIQTPNFWFPVEPHCFTPFFHWLPEPVRVRLVEWFALGNWPRAQGTCDAVLQVQSARLLSKRMFRSLFPHAHLRCEWFCGLPKSFTAVGGLP